MIRKALLLSSGAMFLAGALPAIAESPAAPPAQAATAGERAIDAPAMPVTIKKWMGQDRTFSFFPNRIFVAGYNIGALRKVVAVGKARGGLFNTSQGAQSKSELYADGIDEAMLVRIANAAYSDLIFQLKAAGFEVVPLATARAAAGADKLRLDTPAYSAGGEEILVVGPTATGVRGNTPLAKMELGSMGAPELAMTLESMVVMPNLAFDFAWAQGNRSLGNTATSQTGVRFGINPNHTRNRIFAGKRKQFLEGDFIYAPDANLTTEEQFATIADTERTDNRGMRVANALLGLNVMARSKTTGFAQIDQAAYERLALSAAKGWNAAFVADLRARTGK